MTTTTQTARTCPRSAVADRIVHWDEVREGELVLYAGELHLVEQWMLHTGRPDLYVAVRFRGYDRFLTLPRVQYTAIRGYTEG